MGDTCVSRVTAMIADDRCQSPIYNFSDWSGLIDFTISYTRNVCRTVPCTQFEYLPYLYAAHTLARGGEYVR